MVRNFSGGLYSRGTLFEDRYQVIQINTDEYLRHLCRYIHANPVRHGIADAPELWPYSDYQAWIEPRPDEFVDREFIQAHFETPGHYQAYVQSYLTGEVQLPGLERYLQRLEG